MSETWEQTKARLSAEGINLRADVVVIRPVGRYDEPIPEKPAKRFNVHKRSLPVGIDEVVLFGVVKNEADWWVEHKLKTRCYQDEVAESKTLIYFDIVPEDATPKERSVYFNTHPVTTSDVLGFNSPRRIN